MENRISNLIKLENGKANILHALQSKWGDLEWGASGNTYDGITWSEINEISKPTEAEFDTEVIRLQAEYNAQEYARNRASAYDSIGNQLDLLFHDFTAGKGTKTGEWYKAVAKVKADNPKG